jgi:hypothetical protein
MARSWTGSQVGLENIEEFGAAARGESALTAFLKVAASTLADIRG